MNRTLISMRGFQVFSWRKWKSFYMQGGTMNKMPREAVTSRGVKLRHILFEQRKPQPQVSFYEIQAKKSTLLLERRSRSNADAFINLIRRNLFHAEGQTALFLNARGARSRFLKDNAMRNLIGAAELWIGRCEEGKGRCS